VRRQIVLAVVLLSSAALVIRPAAAGDAPWRIGLARVKITPDGLIRLDGYAARDRPSEGMLSDLHAKAMAFEDRAGHRAILITADLIAFPAAVGKAVRSAIAEKTGLRLEQILLNASHTHSGPVVLLGGYRRPDVPEAERQAVLRYNRKLRGQLVDLAAAALADLKPATLSWGTGTVDFVVNRRERTKHGLRIGINREGFADRSVPVLRVDSRDGVLRAVVFGCACHGVTLEKDSYLISGDYAGFAQERIEARLPGAQAMFMIGCAGSANPDRRGTADMARAHGKALSDEVCRVLTGALKPVRSPLRTELACAEIPLAPVPPREELKRIVKRGRGPKLYTARRMLAALDAGKALPTHYPMPIALWQFRDDLTLVGLSGEVVGEYVPLLREALGPDRLWIAAYCNEVFGYVVTAQILQEGGYETRGLFHQIGFLSPQAQDTLLTTVRDLARKAGRKLPAR